MHTDLRHHGDTEVAPGLIDLAVNVRPGTPPAWLAALLRASVADLAAYPDVSGARAAVARRHGRAPEEVLLTAGAAEAFVLLARALRPRRAVVVHPQFTEPEAALRAAGHGVTRVILDGDFRLGRGSADRPSGLGRPASPGRPAPAGPTAELPGPAGIAAPAEFTAPSAFPAGAGVPVPEDADLVVIGNPTNPTSVLHPAESIVRLVRPGRVVVVDEAFMDCVPGEPESLASGGVPGLVIVRSLTKTWGLAGLRAGYVLADPELVACLAEAQPLWSVSAPALVAIEACTGPRAVAEAEDWARDLAAERGRLAAALGDLGLHVVPEARASFLCVRVRGADRLRLRLRERGFAVRRGDTFPGLGPDWLRVAVRDRRTDDDFLNALRGEAWT